jgi:translation initiation factor 1
MKKSVDGGKDLATNPFGQLRADGLPSFQQPPKPAKPEPQRNRGRVEVRRETAGRGGKVVTTLRGFVGIGAPEKEEIAQALQKRCGCGGSLKDGAVEIQGDQREVAMDELKRRGFQPVLAGG